MPVAPPETDLRAVIGNEALAAALVALYRGEAPVAAAAIQTELRQQALCAANGDALALTPLGKRIAYHLSEYRIQIADGAARRMWEVARVRPGARILDLGCGAGQTLIGLEQPAKVAVGVDVDDLALRLFGVVRDHQHRNDLAPVRGDAERLPFRDAAFDRVVCRVVLMYVHVETVIREIARLTAPSGLVYLHLTDAWFYLTKLARLQWERGGVPFALANGLMMQTVGAQMRARRGRTMNYQTVSRTNRLLREAGFEILSVEQHGRTALGLRRQPKILARRLAAAAVAPTRVASGSSS